jgi:hypothetical protein
MPLPSNNLSLEVLHSLEDLINLFCISYLGLLGIRKNCAFSQLPGPLTMQDLIFSFCCWILLISKKIVVSLQILNHIILLLLLFFSFFFPQIFSTY